MWELFKLKRLEWICDYYSSSDWTRHTGWGVKDHVVYDPPVASQSCSMKSTSTILPITRWQTHVAWTAQGSDVWKWFSVIYGIKGSKTNTVWFWGFSKQTFTLTSVLVTRLCLSTPEFCGDGVWLVLFPTFDPVCAGTGTTAISLDVEAWTLSESVWSLLVPPPFRWWNSSFSFPAPASSWGSLVSTQLLWVSHVSTGLWEWPSPKLVPEVFLLSLLMRLRLALEMRQ